MRVRFVAGVIGLLLAGIGVAMLPCALIDFTDGNGTWQAFALASLLCSLTGAVLALTCLRGKLEMGRTEAFGVTVFSWLVVGFWAALPFYWWGLSPVDAVFESISGLTTTGATVITGLDTIPRGILLWRAMLQWFGGIGLIVLAMAILPMLRVGGMQLFRLENSDQTGKVAGKAREIAGYIGWVYLGLTAACTFGYMATGMSSFNALIHAFTTLSAGGFSTSDSSFGQFAGTAPSLVAIVFMCCAAMPFALFVLAVRGKPMALLTDPQPRLFLAIVLGASALVLAYVSALGLDVSRPGEPAVVVVIFNMVSVMSGTGYATSDYGLWGPFTYWVVLLITIFGGCGGSAAGGLKMFRLHIATSAAFVRYARIAHPRRVIPVRYSGRVVSDEDVKSITVFISLYLMTLVVGALGYMLLGYDTLTAVSASATAVSNVGPGLGPEIGPATTFQSFSDAATAWTTVLMFMGRLELLAVLVLVTPRFWRD